MHNLDVMKLKGRNKVQTPRLYKTFIHAHLAEHEFILLIIVQMPALVGILTFIIIKYNI